MVIGQNSTCARRSPVGVSAEGTYMYDVRIIVYLALGSGFQKCVLKKSMQNLILIQRQDSIEA